MIEHIIEDFAEIMIVSFDKNPKKVYPEEDGLIELDSAERRKEALEPLNDISVGPYTCIGK